MKHRFLLRLHGLLWLAACAAFGCESTGVGNPPQPGTVQLALVGDELGDDNGADAGAEALPASALEHALLVLGEVRWLPCDSAGDPSVQTGPFVVDLLSGETYPEIPSVDVPEGRFCGLDAPLAPARGPAALAGRSLFFSGTRADGVQFLLFADMRATLSLRANTGETWGEREQGQRLLWSMRPRRWATRADLGAAQESAWGGGRRIIRIDVNRHPLLFAAIRARLAGESGLFLDRNDNGRLDAAERAEPTLGSGTTSDE